MKRSHMLDYRNRQLVVVGQTYHSLPCLFVTSSTGGQGDLRATGVLTNHLRTVVTTRTKMLCYLSVVVGTWTFDLIA